MDHTPLCIGARTYWVADDPQPVFLAEDDRKQPLYVIGKTGLGKSTLLRNLILQDLHAGRGVGLLDPHGDLAEEVLGLVPRSRTKEVLYFNPGDLAHPVGLNLLSRVPPDSRHLVVSGILSASRGIWGESWGPRMEYILERALAALLDCGGMTLLALPRLLSDDQFRERVARRVRDPIVRAFWEEEYPAYEKRFRLEAIAPIQNKVGRLLSNAPLRNIIGQVRNRFDLPFLMDCSRIVIANLAKGVIGQDQSRLLGALLLSQIEWAAMQRASLPESERTPFHLYIDEVQCFATDALTAILAESRKYGLCVTVCHQFFDQIPEPIQRAVLGSAGNLMAFRVSQRDALVLEEEFSGEVKAGILVSLGKGEFCARLVQDGIAGLPFRGRALPRLEALGTARRTAIIRHSRERYGRPRAKLEATVGRVLGSLRGDTHRSGSAAHRSKR